MTHVVALGDGRQRFAGERALWEETEASHLIMSSTTGALPEACFVPPATVASFSPGDPLVCFRGVSVAYNGRAVVDDITFTLRCGDHMMISGPNGSGKSTLLSMINGDNPKAYGNDISLFGKQRGTGESIWEIKKQIGLPLI